MKRRQGFTLIELLVVISIIALLIGILLPSLGRAREVANRAVCSANLRSIHQALYAYGASNRGRFSRWGTSGSNLPTRDMTQQPRINNSNATSLGFTDNMTASLWILVRQNSAVPKTFICAADKAAEPDPMTANGLPGTPVPIINTWDFCYNPANGNVFPLSFSLHNMFNASNGAANWSQDARPDWVLAGDSNNVTAGHVNAKSANKAANIIQTQENSQNHTNGEGQNFLKGDGSVSFENDPFQGPDGDNAMGRMLATGGGGAAASGGVTPPILTGNVAYTSPAGTYDSCLIPIWGNGGTSLTTK